MKATTRRAADRGGPAQSGFTLIEVLVALAILAFSLSTLMGAQASVAQQLRFADQLQNAAMLVRSQMAAIEQHLTNEGFEATIYADCGDFEETGFVQYSWCVEVEPVEISDAAEDEFVANIHGELFGSGAGESGSLSGSAAVSQFLPMIIGQIPEFINQIGERTRLVRLEVTWDSPFGTRSLTATEYYTVLELSQTDTQAADTPDIDQDALRQAVQGARDAQTTP